NNPASTGTTGPFQGSRQRYPGRWNNTLCVILKYQQTTLRHPSRRLLLTSSPTKRYWLQQNKVLITCCSAEAWPQIHDYAAYSPKEPPKPASDSPFRP